MTEQGKQDGNRASTQIARSNKPGNPAWIKGVSGNPVGRPRHARERLTERIVTDLANDWADNGAKAVSDLRQRDVAAYVRVCVSLLPKEVHIATGPLEELDEEELSALVYAAKNAVAKANAN